MSPIAAGAIALIPARQFAADGARHYRRQWSRTHVHPGLEMARAGFHHGARLMPLCAHGSEHAGLGLIQIDQNVAGIAANCVRLKVHVIAIVVTSAQEAHDRFPSELRSGPQSHPRQRSAAVVVNQTDEIPFARHGRELAMNGLERKRQSAIRHDAGASWLAQRRQRSRLEAKFALYRETLQATARTARILIAPREFATMPWQPTPQPSFLSHRGARFPDGHHQLNMAWKTGYRKGDISILLGRGHFYFALTSKAVPLTPTRAL